jgi:hypothetical protein
VYAQTTDLLQKQAQWLRDAPSIGPSISTRSRSRSHRSSHTACTVLRNQSTPAGRRQQSHPAPRVGRTSRTARRVRFGFNSKVNRFFFIILKKHARILHLVCLLRKIKEPAQKNTCIYTPSWYAVE